MEWTSKQELRLSELYDKFGNNYAKIVEEMSSEFQKKFTYNSVRNKIRRSSIIEYIPDKRGEGLFEGFDNDEVFNSYVEAKRDIFDILTMYDEQYKEKDEVEVFVISDLHVPLTNLDALEKAILENQSADVCIIGGDFLDYKSISSYGNKREINVEKEYKKAFDILKIISNIFDTVLMINGNHEQRLTRYFEHKVVTALSEYLDNKHKPLSEISRFFDNVYYVNHWFVQFGPLLVVHPSRYSKINLRSVRNAVEDRIEKEHRKEFREFSTVLMGHTHRMGKALFSGVISCEIGCMEKLDIEFRNKDAKGKKWVNGYAKVTIKNNKIDWNDVHVVRV